MTNLNLLFILPEYYPHSGGGISTYYIQYLETLKKSVAKIKVIVGSGYTQSENSYNLNGIEIEYLKPEIFNKYLNQFERFSLFPEYRRNIAAAWAMWQQCNKGTGFDMVECVDFGLGFVPWVCEQKTPVITRLHGSTGQIELNEPSLHENLNGDLHRQTEYILLSLSTAIITHSEANKRYWSNILLGKKIDIIYPIYVPNNQSWLSKKDKKPIGIVCGRIQEWKGPDILCEALNLLADTEAIINWYGRDTNYDGKITKGEQLKQKYPNVWGLKIIPNSPVPNRQLVQIQREANFAIIPSTWDMFNFTGLEYMSVGTPVICADGAGFSELIIDGVNGFKYSKYDYTSLANCIEKVTNLSTIDYNSIVERAKQTFATTLESAKLIKENFNVYESAMANFMPNKRNAFIEALYYPANMPNKIDDVLDKQPLKTLVKYTLKRLMRKFKSK